MSVKSRVLGKATAKQAAPTNLAEFMRDVVEAVEAATGGSTKTFIKNLDHFVDLFLRKSATAAEITKFLRLEKRLGKGPKVRILGPGEAGKYLKARGKDLEPFKISPDKIRTRRTGGVVETRAFRHKDGAIEFELAGPVQDSISFLRQDRSIPELGIHHKGLDYSKSLASASTKTYNGVSLKGYQRLHAWGHGFGDETDFGMTYGPEEFNQLEQRLGIEEKIIAAGNRLRADGGELILRERVLTYPPDTTKNPARVRHGQQEFVLKEISYDLEVRKADGSVFTGQVILEVPPPGTSARFTFEFFGTDLLLLGEKLGSS